MAHAAQDGGLDRVASSQRFRFECLASKPLAIKRYREQRRQGGKETSADGEAPAGFLGDVQRSDGAAVRDERVRGLAGAGTRARVELDPRSPDVEQPADGARDAPELVGKAPALQQRRGQLGEKGGLALALF